MIGVIPKRFLILIGICILLVGSIIITTYTRKKTPLLNQVSPSPISSNFPVSVSNGIQITPSTATILELETTPTFTLNLAPNTDLNQISISLTKQSFDESEPSLEKINITNQANTLRVNLQNPIEPSSYYTLEVTNKSTNHLLGHFTYTSDDSPLSVETNNNLELKQYLPYQTSSYHLIYLPNRNLYVFSFSYNPDSNDSVESQFNAAKEDALGFIRSKNIDPDSLKIEWRYH